MASAGSGVESGILSIYMPLDMHHMYMSPYICMYIDMHHASGLFAPLRKDSP